jgi:Glycosyl hydrolases family 43
MHRHFLVATAPLLTVCCIWATASAQLPAPKAPSQVATADSPLPADSLPDHPERGPFLFCYFLGNGDGLHLASSVDGLQMTPLNHDAIYLKPTIGGGLMRDPCIRQGSDGVYHLVWTTGWWDKGFGVSSSPDLIHWSPQQFVEVNKDNPTAINTWAPELFYNDQKREWMVFWATTIPGEFSETEPPAGKGDSGPNKNQPLNHRIYYVSTKDFQKWSDAKLLVDPGFNCIDATIAKIPANGTPLAGKYVMVLKDETIVPAARKNLRVLTADNPEGPWPAASEPITKDWVEGPTIAQVGDAWYIYYDEYRNHTYGAVRTGDFKTFDVVKENFAFPNGARHGTVFPVTPATLERLESAAIEK